jgi:predicted ATPase/DNA-binding winged helix-turn-helix (wHTH) protein
MLRTTSSSRHEVVSIGAFRLFPSQRLLLKGDTAVKLGSRAFDILLALADQAGEVVGRRELLARVWPGVLVEEVSLRVHMAALRKVLEEGGESGRYLTNVPGRGYCLVAPISRTTTQDDWDGTPVTRPTYALPPVLDRMVGRQEAIREISDKLESERFVTLVGPGGIGKTTVALAVAHALLAAFDSAVCFVELSPVGDPALIASAITAAFGLPVRDENPTPELLAHLHNKRVLLVLDGCEHVIDEAASVAQRLFDGAGQLHIVATSREALRAEGERIYRLPPLDSPPEDADLMAAAALAYPATQLFVNRMASAGLGEDLSDEEVRIVSGMCRRLGGIALAIELAAGRVAVFGVHETAAMLNTQFALLWPGRRTSPPRHQTLNATIDWSYNLLSEAERFLLRRLSVFAGAFTADAAHQLVRADLTDEQFFDATTGLVEKSLASIDTSGAIVRYRLLDSTRAYAARKLEEACEVETARRRHAHYYCELLRATAADAVAPEKPTASTVDLDDVRAALQWSFDEEGDRLLGADIAAYSAPMWLDRALLVEARAWMAKAAEAIVEGATSQQQLRIETAFASTELYIRGLAETTIAAWQKALERAAALNDVAAQLRCYLVLWGGVSRAGQYAQALTIAEKCAALARGTSDRGAQAMSEWMLGSSKCSLGTLAESRGHLERYLLLETQAARLAQIKATGYDRLSDALRLLALVRWILGLPDQARADGKRAVTEAQSLGLPIPIGTAMCSALTTYLSEPDLDVVEHDAVELLDHATTHSIAGDAGMGLCLLGLSQAQRDDFEAGARLVSRGLDTLAGARRSTFNILILANICEAALKAGRPDDAAAWMKRLIGEDHSPDHWCSSEVFRVQGLLAESKGDDDAAAELMARGADLARRQDALSWELRSATCLSRLRARQGRTVEARDTLLAVYGRFSEGFETRDLVAARNLIEELS